jgi:hypothetical protein
MIKMIQYTEEQTILQPRHTEFIIDAFLYDATYVNTQNRDGVFSVVFAPYTFQDHQRLCELIESAVMEVELKKGFYSNKKAVAKTEKGGGLFYSSQLFTPRIEPKFLHTDELVGKQCSIKGHLRDLPLGEVVIQAAYIDLYDPLNGVDPDSAAEANAEALAVPEAVNEDDDW